MNYYSGYLGTYYIILLGVPDALVVYNRIKATTTTTTQLTALTRVYATVTFLFMNHLYCLWSLTAPLKYDSSIVLDDARELHACWSSILAQILRSLNFLPAPSGPLS